MADRNAMIKESRPEYEVFRHNPLIPTGIARLGIHAPRGAACTGRCGCLCFGSMHIRLFSDNGFGTMIRMRG